MFEFIQDTFDEVPHLRANMPRSEVVQVVCSHNYLLEELTVPMNIYVLNSQEEEGGEQIRSLQEVYDKLNSEVFFSPACYFSVLEI